ncbi:hypothetical protein AAMO2058_000846300 [Amorphochlora amoebiformis]
MGSPNGPRAALGFLVWGFLLFAYSTSPRQPILSRRRNSNSRWSVDKEGGGVGEEGYRFFIPAGTSYVDYIRRYLVKKQGFVYVETSKKKAGNESLDYFDINGNSRKKIIGRIMNRLYDKSHLCTKHKLAYHLRKHQGDVIPPTAIVRRGVWTQVPRGFLNNSESEEGRRSVFFLKDSHRDNGHGIFVGIGLAKTIPQIESSRTYVLQRHLENMLLWNGMCKFDLRMFSIAVFRPFCRPQFYLYPHGYCRVNPTPWQMSAKKDLQVTNISFFKRKNLTYSLVPTQDWPEFNLVEPGIRHAITTAYRETQDFMHPMHEENTHAGYMLFGFDFLVDSNHKPWLLEVNASPGCSRNRRPPDMVHNLQQMFDQLAELAIIPLLNSSATPNIGSWIPLDTQNAPAKELKFKTYDSEQMKAYMLPSGGEKQRRIKYRKSRRRSPRGFKVDETLEKSLESLKNVTVSL